jgi:electron transfer flavoprotein beta subunit
VVNIIVCIKQVLDPEAPTSAYKVDEETKRMTQKGVPPVMSPFDENALEAALRIKDAHEAQITVLSMGQNLSKAVLRKSLAAGADNLILLEDDTFNNLDSFTTASIMAAAIKKVGEYDIILAGMQAADWNAGIVGSGIAEILGIPSVTVAREVELIDSKAKVKRVTPDGHEVIETSLPALITVSNELGELRATALKEIMAAQKKPLTTWNAGDIGIDTSKQSRPELLSLSIPQKESRCEMVSGETDEESAANLALKLRETQII